MRWNIHVPTTNEDFLDTILRLGLDSRNVHLDCTCGTSDHVVHSHHLLTDTGSSVPTQ
jgi:hypothetical protein